MKLNNLFKSYSGLPRGIYILFIGRIIIGLGNFIFPFLALYLTDILKYSPSLAGFYVMLSAICAMIGSLIGGKLTDVIGRKIIMCVAFFSASMILVTCTIPIMKQYTPHLLIACQFFFGIGRPAFLAMINDLTTAENRHSSFALLYLGLNLGMAISPMVAGLLYTNHTMLLFLCTAIASFLFFLLVLFFLKETFSKKWQTEKNFILNEASQNPLEKAESGNLFQVLIKRPLFLFFLFGATFLSVIYAQHAFSLPLQLNDIFTNLKGPQYFGYIMTINCIYVLIFTLPLISYTKKFKTIFNLGSATICYGIGFGMLYFTRDFYWFIISTFIWTTGEILTTTNINVYIANHSPISHRGRFNSIFPILSNIGFAMSPLVAGKLIEKTSIAQIWPICFVLAVICTGIFIAIGIIEKKNNIRVKNQPKY